MRETMGLTRSTSCVCLSVLLLLLSRVPRIWATPQLQWPINSCSGVLFAIAIPLNDLKGQSVFMSYNYQANYNVPTVPEEVVPGPYIRFVDDLGDHAPTASADERSFNSNKIVVISRNVSEDIDSGEMTSPVNHVGPDNIGVVVKRDAPREGMFTRSRLYRIVQQKIDRFRLNGKACLLRAICEAAADPIHEHNGIIGDIVHVILTPSTTEKEDRLHPIYFRAEDDGVRNDCFKYERKCPVNVLDFLSECHHLPTLHRH